MKTILVLSAILIIGLTPRLGEYLHNETYQPKYNIVYQAPKVQNPDILWKIYGLESTWGKNDSCKSKGRFNGYGYGIYGGLRPCYYSHGVVSLIVDKWLLARLSEGLTLPQLLCYYNTGRITNNCSYYQDYLSL